MAYRYPLPEQVLPPPLIFGREGGIPRGQAARASTWLGGFTQELPGSIKLSMEFCGYPNWRRIRDPQFRALLCTPLVAPVDVHTLADYLIPHYYPALREFMLAFVLDGRLRIMGWHTVGIGTLHNLMCEPADVFRPALLMPASSLILVHTHPSGDPTPSPEDIALTARLETVGELLGISMLDHLILGNGCYASLAELGHIDRRSSQWRH